MFDRVQSEFNGIDKLKVGDVLRKVTVRYLDAEFRTITNCKVVFMDHSVIVLSLLADGKYTFHYIGGGETIESYTPGDTIHIWSEIKLPTRTVHSKIDYLR